jgi:hypothetical protein
VRAGMQWGVVASSHSLSSTTPYAVLCCAVLCCAVLCCAVLCYAVLCSPYYSWAPATILSAVFGPAPHPPVSPSGGILVTESFAYWVHLGLWHRGNRRARLLCHDRGGGSGFSRGACVSRTGARLPLGECFWDGWAAADSAGRWCVRRQAAGMLLLGTALAALRRARYSRSNCSW